jgi:Ni/Co efflux regulator RcnB
MNKSKSMAAVAAVLAMCMGGSAFAEDQRSDGGPDRHDQQLPRVEHGPGADRDHRNGRPQPQFIGRGYVQPYADWHRGDRLSGEFREMPS